MFVSWGSPPRCCGRRAAEAGLEPGKAARGGHEWELPLDLLWGCQCCCCDLLQHEGLIRQVVKYCWSCWAGRVLAPAWLYNHLSIKQPHFGVWGRFGVFLACRPRMAVRHSPRMCVCVYMAARGMSILTTMPGGKKDEPSRRFGTPGLTSNSLAANTAPALLLVSSTGGKKPCFICSCNSSWSGLDFVFKSLCDYTAQSPEYVHKAIKKKKKKMRHFKIQPGFKKVCLNCKKYGTSARDFGVLVKIEILLQDLLHYWAIISIPS